MADWGGKREGAGRPIGSYSEITKEKQNIEREFKGRILIQIHELLTSMLTLAKGTSYLFRIDEEKDSKGRVLSKKHILVTDPDEIRNVLDEADGTGVVDDHYYYITTKNPEVRALDSLIDRVFGKSLQKADITSGGEPIPILGGITRLPVEEANKIFDQNVPTNNRNQEDQPAQETD